jgi:hypothetical protein
VIKVTTSTTTTTKKNLHPPYQLGNGNDGINVQ